MDRKLRKILTECIREIESGDSSMEDCLQRYPDRAAELRPHLELWRSLNAAPMAQPNLGSQQRGQHQLLGALADMEKRGDERPMIPALAKAAAVTVAAALLIGGAAGTSAALGGPDVAGEVLTTVGITSDHDDGVAENTLETVDANTPEKADFGIDTAQDAVEDGGVDGLDIAEDRAEDGLTTAEEAQGQAGSGVPEGVELPDDAREGVPPDGVPPEGVPPGDVPPGDVPPDGVPPEDVPPPDPKELPLPDSVPDDAPVPEEVPPGSVPLGLEP